LRWLLNVSIDREQDTEPLHHARVTTLWIVEYGTGHGSPGDVWPLNTRRELDKQKNSIMFRTRNANHDGHSALNMYG
jgi:hypothetical protein